MVDYDKLYNKAKTKYDTTCRSIACIPDNLALHIQFVSEKDIYPSSSKDYQEMLVNLRLFAAKNGKYELVSYYTASGYLVVVYAFTNCNVNFYINDMANALAKLSKGKCHIETSTRTETDHNVVCDL